MKFFSHILIIFSLFLPAAIAQTTLNQIDQMPFAQGISGDFAGDGHIEFVTFTDEGIVMYQGRDDGFLTGQSVLSSITFGNMPIPVARASAIGDLNGDGKLDIAIPLVGASQGSIAIVFGQVGGFHNPYTISLPSQIGQLQPLHLIDLNNDHHLDILTQDNNGNIVVLLGNGDGTFQVPMVTPAVNIGASGATTLAAVADVNQDGFADMLLSNSTTPSSYFVSLGNGSGSFEQETAINLDVTDPSNTTLQFLGLQDIDGDSKPDLLLYEAVKGSTGTSQAINFIVLSGKGDGTFNAPQLQSAGVPTVAPTNDLYIYVPWVMDLNQDGKTDILMVAQSDFDNNATCCFTYLSQGKGDGTFAAATRLTTFSSTMSQNPPGLFTTPPQKPSASYVPLNFGNNHVGFIDDNGMEFLPENSGPSIYLPTFSLPSGMDFSGATLTFAGTSDLVVSSVTTTNPFVVTGSVLSGQNCCTVYIYKETSENGIFGDAYINSNDGTSPLDIPIISGDEFGNKQPPDFSASPSALDFGYLKAGTTSSQTVTFNNTSGAPATISSVSFSPPAGTFSLSSTNCSGQIKTSCTAVITFSPVKAVQDAGNITIIDSNQQSVTATFLGNGYQVGPVAQMSPNSIAFGNAVVGTTKGTLTATITNAGDAPLQVQSISVSAPFSIQSTTCSTTQPLAPQALCNASLNFAPTKAGAQSGSLVLTDNAPGSPQSLQLTGTGIAPAFAANPASVDFGDQIVGDSTMKQVVLTNISGAPSPASISLDAANTDFTQSNTCSGTIAAGANCMVTIVFKPRVQFLQSVDLIALDSNSLSTKVPIKGTAHLVPSFTASPSTLSFGYVKVNTTSTVHQITVANPTQHAATLSVGNNASFVSETNTCGTSLAAGASCVFSFTATPTIPGTLSGAISLTDQFGQILQIPLSVISYTLGPVATIAPTTLAFGNQIVNTTSSPQQIKVQNTGDIPLVIQSISAGAGFQETNSCNTLAPGATCGITVAFAPTSIGNVTSVLTITDNTPTSPQTVQLTGAGIGAPVKQLQITPTTLTFGSQFLGSSSLPQAVTIANTGTLPVAIQSAATADPFGVVNACGNSIAPGSSCSIGVFFEPSATGAQSGILTITDDAPNSPQTVQLNGTGATVSIAASGGSSTSATINQGGTATYNLALAAQDGFIGSLAVSCTGAPSGYQCVPNTNSVSFSSGSPTASVNFSVNAVTAKSAGMSPRSFMGGLAAITLLYVLFPAAFRRRAGKVGSFIALFGACVLFLAMSACGGGNGSSMKSTPPSTTQAQYTLQAVFTTQSGEKLQQPLSLTIVSQSN